MNVRCTKQSFPQTRIPNSTLAIASQKLKLDRAPHLPLCLWGGHRCFLLEATATVFCPPRGRFLCLYVCSSPQQLGTPLVPTPCLPLTGQHIPGARAPSQPWGCGHRGLPLLPRKRKRTGFTEKVLEPHSVSQGRFPWQSGLTQGLTQHILQPSHHHAGDRGGTWAQDRPPRPPTCQVPETQAYPDLSSLQGTR